MKRKPRKENARRLGSRENTRKESKSKPQKSTESERDRCKVNERGEPTKKQRSEAERSRSFRANSAERRPIGPQMNHTTEAKKTKKKRRINEKSQQNETD